MGIAPPKKEREVLIMKFCEKCGKELMDEAVVCVGCGCPVNTTPAQQPYQPAPQQARPAGKSGSVTAAMICAFLMPLIGLIVGLVGMSKNYDPQLKNKYKSVMLLSIGMWIIYFVIFMAMGQM